MQDDRMFPIQRQYAKGDLPRLPGGQVPWCVAERAYEVYAAKYGTHQTLEHLAERGGFGWNELVWLLRGGKDDFMGDIREKLPSVDPPVLVCCCYGDCKAVATLVVKGDRASIETLKGWTFRERWLCPEHTRVADKVSNVNE
jgi:hypothetical protein